MNAIVEIPLPLPHIGSVNAWLLKGDPLTLVDTGPRDDRALAALEAGLRREGVRLEDVELVLGTHHHLDHIGLAATIQRRSGARIAVLDATAGYVERYADRTAMDRRFSRALMAHHGVPAAVIADTEGFWDYLFDGAERFDADVRLRDGDRIRAGGRDLRVLARPGHSTTDTLFVDDADGIAFVGDHLLARISSNTEIYPGGEPDGTRPRARIEYLRNLRRTAGMPLRRLLTGHGRPVTAHAHLVEAPARRAPAPLPADRGDPRRRAADGVRDRGRPVAAGHARRAAAVRRLGGPRPPGPADRRGRGRRAHRRRRPGPLRAHTAVTSPPFGLSVAPTK